MQQKDAEWTSKHPEPPKEEKREIRSFIRAPQVSAFKF